jgi:hypothetical protein
VVDPFLSGTWRRQSLIGSLGSHCIFLRLVVNLSQPCCFKLCFALLTLLRMVPLCIYFASKSSPTNSLDSCITVRVGDCCLDFSNSMSPCWFTIMIFLLGRQMLVGLFNCLRYQSLDSKGLAHSWKIQMSCMFSTKHVSQDIAFCT